MKKARHRALTLVISPLLIRVILVEMKKARHRALTHYVAKSKNDHDNNVEMKKARHRALTPIFCSYNFKSACT